VAIGAALQAGSLWWLTALAPWAVALAVCAVADAATQRVPTKVVRVAGVVVLIALACTAAALTDYRPLIVGAVGAVIAFGIVALGWKYADVGRGDVRLATLGGLGLGASTLRGLVIGIFAFALVAGIHAAVTYARTRDRKSRIPLGPALTVCFFTAVLV
jgi:leader peptidase (prepilin peptidase)/N-methyltransferase